MRDQVKVIIRYIKHIPNNKQRVLSFGLTAMQVGGAFGLIILGWVARDFSIKISWLIASLFFWLALLPLFKLYKKKKC